MSATQINWNDPPLTLTFDELIASPAYYNGYDNALAGPYYRWHVLLTSGWIYTGDASSEVGRRCSPEARLDPVMMEVA